MPAKTVAFTVARKVDGKEFRNLLWESISGCRLDVVWTIGGCDYVSGRKA